MVETAPKVEFKASKKTALVAGGAGFIGSQLVATLISQNFKVLCVDNLSTGKKDNLKDLLTHPDLAFIEADITDPAFRLPPEVKIDYCFHLASSEEYKDGPQLSLNSLLVNSLGTKQLLEIARAQQAKFILASSADLYSGAISNTSLRYYFGKNPGEEAVLSVHEAKRFSEALAFEYFKKFNLPVTITRLKDVYGPKMNLERGDEIANLLKQSLHGQPLEVVGDGLKILNPTFVSDVVFGLVKSALGEFSGEIFILASSEKVTVESFAQTVKLVVGPLEVKHTKDTKGLDYTYHNIDLDNTRSKLNWNPKVTLAEGIGTIVQQYRLAQRGEASGALDNTVPRLAEPISLTTPSSDQAVSKPQTKKGYTTWLRLVVFISSSLLLLFTVVYPIAGFAAKSYLGKSDLESAFSQFGAEKTALASNKALKAENYLHAAQSDLQNVNWLLKIVGLSKRSANSDRLLLAGETLAEALRNFTQASQVIVTTSANQEASQEEITSKLKDAQIGLQNSQDRLEEVQVLLTTINWGELSPGISLKKEFMVEKTNLLAKQADELTAAIDAVLTPN